MQSFRLINQEEIASLLDMDTILGAVEQAYADKCRGLAQLFPVVCHSFEDGVSEFDIKSGSLDGAGVFGMKLVSAFAGNSDLGLPRLTGTILVFDRRTGMLKSMMDGGLITNMRTGAAGAVGCKYLARPDSEDLLLVGTGAQGPGLLEATLAVMGGIRRIRVVNPRSPEKAADFCARVRESIPAQVDLLAADDLEEAVRRSDIVLTATPSRRALIRRGWVRRGTHFSCIGSDMEGKQELEESILAEARVFCDDLNQVVKIGECEKAVRQGLLSPEGITELGNVILGQAPGRRTKEEVTVFDSTGIALQDLITAARVTALAEERGLGRSVLL